MSRMVALHTCVIAGTGLVAGGALVLVATALVTGFNPVARLLAADAASPKP